MGPEHADTALAESAQQVLETMCFADSSPIQGPPEECAEPIAAQVEFRGHWTGRCIVEMPENCARELAGNFLGVLDASEVEAESMIELMCEFTNMICGSTITRLQCPGLVTLSSPHLVSEWPADSLEQTAECRLDVGNGVVRVAFETGEPA